MFVTIRQGLGVPYIFFPLLFLYQFGAFWLSGPPLVVAILG
jgi:hypothetical protein